MRRNIWLVAFLGLCLTAFAFWARCDGSSALASTPATSTFTVRRGDLDITVIENGTLVAKDSRKVVPQFRTEGKVVFLLEEGKSVQEGEVICRIDSVSLQSQVEQLEMELVQAEAANVTAITELEIQRTENVTSIEKAKITLDVVRLDEEKYRDGEAPQERRRLEVAIKDAETDHNRAQKRYDDSKKLVEQDFIKRSELEQHAIDLEKATVGLESSKLALHLFEKYTRPMTLRKNVNAVKDAERELETAEKRSKSRLNQREADALQADTRIKRLRTQLEARRKDIENMTLLAPCPGILIYGDPREPWYREQVKLGGTIYGGNTLMTIPDLRVMQVKIQVHEADINKVSVGQSVVVTMDTYPGLVLNGEVARVANIAAAGNPWSGTSSEVKRFDVEVLLKDTEKLALKPGISAKAEIHVDKLVNVLFVPLQCAFLENGTHLCLVADLSGPVPREVKVGLNNETYVEVVTGLELGEQVMLYNPFLSTPDASEAQGTESPTGEEPAARPSGPTPAMSGDGR